MWTKKLDSLSDYQRILIYKHLSIYIKKNEKRIPTLFIGGSNDLEFPDPNTSIIRKYDFNLILVEPLNTFLSKAIKKLKSYGYVKAIKESSKKLKNFTSYQVALSSSNGKEKFYLGTHRNNTNSSLIGNNSDHLGQIRPLAGDVIEVETNTYETLFCKNKPFMEKIDCFHLDLEGLDYLIISQIIKFNKNNNLNFPALIEWECNNLTSEKNGDEILNFLEENGYKNFHLNKFYDYSGWGDILSIHEETLKMLGDCFLNQREISLPFLIERIIKKLERKLEHFVFLLKLIPKKFSNVDDAKNTLRKISLVRIIKILNDHS